MTLLYLPEVSMGYEAELDRGEGIFRMLLFIEMELVNNSRNQWIELSLRYWINRFPHRKWLLSDRPYLYIKSLPPPPAGKMSSILWFHPGPVPY